MLHDAPRRRSVPLCFYFGLQSIGRILDLLRSFRIKFAVARGKQSREVERKQRIGQVKLKDIKPGHCAGCGDAVNEQGVSLPPSAHSRTDVTGHQDEVARLNASIDAKRRALYGRGKDAPRPLGSAFIQCNLQMGAHVLAQCVSYHEVRALPGFRRRLLPQR